MKGMLANRELGGLSLLALGLAGCNIENGAAETMLVGGPVVLLLGALMIRGLAALHDAGRSRREPFEWTPHLVGLLFALGVAATAVGREVGLQVLFGVWFLGAIYLPALAITWRAFRSRSPELANTRSWVIAAAVLYVPPIVQVTGLGRGFEVSMILLWLSGWGAISAVVLLGLLVEALVRCLGRSGAAEGTSRRGPAEVAPKRTAR
ncbi:MAG: hypothetical protein U0414_42415 [Polyangiaceae bacterium]